MKKQILLFILTLLPMFASADESGTCGENLTWTYEEATKTLTISGSGEMKNYYKTCPWKSCDIQSAIIKSGVTNIGDYAFYYCRGLTSVTIPNSVTSIGQYAFSYCSGLTSVTIPNSVTSIKDGAFYDCSGLTSVIIPNCVTNIGVEVFRGCRGLTSVTIPNSVTRIENSAFYDCSGLTSVIIANGVTSIGDYAFRGCTGLTSVTIPTSVTSIGGSAFYYCDNLQHIRVPVTDYADFCNNKNIGLINGIGKPVQLIDEEGNEIKEFIIPSSVTSIGDYVFRGCTGLTSVTIPNSVTSIGNSAFDGCYGLTSVTIPNSVTSIGNDAFYSTSLKTLIIGTGVLSIGNNAFNNRPVKTIWLTNTPPQGFTKAQGSVNYVANNQYSGLNNMKEYKFLSSMFEVDGVRYVPVSPSDRTCDVIDCVNDESISEVNVKPTVSYKGVEMTILNVMLYSFYGNKHLQRVSCDVAGCIGECAFYNCENLQTATLGEKITGIDEYAFSGCAKLGAIVVPDSVKTIGRNAFSGCLGLESVRIGNGTSFIGLEAFNGCSGLASVSIGNGTRSIMNSAFSGCSVLPRILIPGSVAYLGDNIFSGCNSLREVVMSDRKKGANTILFDDWYTNSNETKTIAVSAGDTLSFDYQVTNGRLKISYGPNYDNYSSSGTYKREFSYPQTITIYFSPNNSSSSASCSITNMKLIESGLLTLGSNGSKSLFADCPLDSVYIGRNISYNKDSFYGYSPFYRNTSLRSVVITDKEEEISDNEFYGCTNLQNVQIGDGVTTIGNWAFSGCASLQNFAFGTQVKTIGKEAFSDCTAVTAIVSKAQTPPVCDAQALDDINKWSCTLTVPKGCKDSYATADQWKEFFFVEEGEGGGQNPDNPDVKRCETPTISYSKGKLTFSCGTAGATCLSTIKDTDITSYNTNEVQLGVTYLISVYATKEGYENSATATATLCWIDVEPKTEGIENGIASIRANAVLIQSANGKFSISGVDEGTPIIVYNTAGQEVGSGKANDGVSEIFTTLRKGEIGIIKIGEKAVKAMMR